MRVIGSLAAWIRRTGQSGVTTVEYSIMLLMVSLAVISTLGPGLSGAVDSVFSRMALNLADEEAARGDAADYELDASGADVKNLGWQCQACSSWSSRDACRFIRGGPPAVKE